MLDSISAHHATNTTRSTGARERSLVYVMVELIIGNRYICGFLACTEVLMGIDGIGQFWTSLNVPSATTP